MTDTPAARPRAAAALARGVTATWWYTASSVVFFLATTLFVWFLSGLLARDDADRGAFLVWYAVGAAMSLSSAVLLLLEYRRGRFLETDRDLPAWSRPLLLAGLAAGAVAAVLLAALTSSVLCGAALFAFTLALMTWPPGVRLRLTLLVLVLLAALWWVEGPVLQPVDRAVLPHPVLAVALAAVTVVSLWWWDIVVELDRARMAEGRLAAAQERLRLATDLHDLQGHHLQVIALQLELAERTMTRDPAAAIEHVRSAQRSVDDARAGTRELATRFRGVPLPDELANAADLLTAAGLRVQVDVAPSADLAPADVLGPVVRECTTNVLKHGGGGWTALQLRRDAASWVLRIANDVSADAPAVGEGAGLAGIAERVRAVGGRAVWQRTGDAFEVEVDVPAGAGAVR